MRGLAPSSCPMPGTAPRRCCSSAPASRRSARHRSPSPFRWGGRTGRMRSAATRRSTMPHCSATSPTCRSTATSRMASARRPRIASPPSRRRSRAASPGSASRTPPPTRRIRCTASTRRSRACVRRQARRRAGSCSPAAPTIIWAAIPTSTTPSAGWSLSPKPAPTCCSHRACPISTRSARW